MNPVIGKGRVVRAFALRDLVFVMRKFQIRTATVDIERDTQHSPGHGRTFNVPPWAPATPR